MNFTIKNGEAEASLIVALSKSKIQQRLCISNWKPNEVMV